MMLTHLSIVLSTIIILEFLNYIKFLSLVKKNLSFYSHISNLFKNSFTDKQKEKMLLGYSKNLFFSSLIIIIIIATITIFIIVINVFVNNFISTISSFVGLIEIILSSIIYLLIKNKINAKL